jgi:hypothetical protein
VVRRLTVFLLLAAAPAWGQGHHGADMPLAVSAIFDDAGRLWRAQVWEGRVWVSHSDDKGQSFSTPVAVNEQAESIAADGENRPKLAVVGQRVYVSWTQRLPKPYTGHVRFARSLDGGRHFSAPLTVNDDRAVISHRFDSLLVDGRGRIHLFWLDKRDAAAAQAAGRPYAGAALYHAVSDDGGAHFSPNTRLAANSCECCRVVSALDTDGLPLVFWRHIFGRNVRDHALLKLDGSAPVRVSHDGWEVDACPHHGPALAVGADGTRHLAWFNDGPERHGLFYARMDPAGQLSPPLGFGNYDAQAGHPSVVVVGTRVFLAWKEFDGQRASVWIRASRDGGRSWYAPRRLMDTAGASDHPLLISDGATAYVSWNTAQDGYRLQAVEDAAP